MGAEVHDGRFSHLRAYSHETISASGSSIELKLWIFNLAFIKTKRIIKAIVWSVALCAAETWKYRKEAIRRLRAFEMWVWRKMEKASWRDMKTNEEVLQLVQEKKSLMDVIWRRKKNWIGHILRGESLLRDHPFMTSTKKSGF